MCRLAVDCLTSSTGLSCCKNSPPARQSAGQERAVAADQSFPVVGVGASAGGLEALEGFFRAMPADSGMAFVVVTHLPRGHATALPEILSRYTDMTVRSIEHGSALEPNVVYVCPSDHLAGLVDGRLVLDAVLDDTARRPIDAFFSSLAEGRGDN